MTGIERLRHVAHGWDSKVISSIADQIDRELREERDRWDDDLSEAQVAWNRVAAVMLDMERHCLGHEGMEDSPVARWARELRDALKSDTSEVGDTQTPSWHDPAEDADVTSEAAEVTRDPAEDVSMSAYDLLPEDERDAIAWVREHGGLDYVRTEWRSRVPRDRYERKRQRLLRHIAECETALGRRREIISKLTHRVSDLTRENAELRRRAMPEGCEWPRFEDGEPVVPKVEYVVEDPIFMEATTESGETMRYPTAVRERVVRCRDCRRSFEERGELWCRGIVGPPVEPGGFCAWGERRD